MTRTFLVNGRRCIDQSWHFRDSAGFISSATYLPEQKMKKETEVVSSDSVMV